MYNPRQSSFKLAHHISHTCCNFRSPPLSPSLSASFITPHALTATSYPSTCTSSPSTTPYTSYIHHVHYHTNIIPLHPMLTTSTPRTTHIQSTSSIHAAPSYAILAMARNATPHHTPYPLIIPPARQNTAHLPALASSDTPSYFHVSYSSPMKLPTNFPAASITGCAIRVRQDGLMECIHCFT